MIYKKHKTAYLFTGAFFCCLLLCSILARSLHRAFALSLSNFLSMQLSRDLLESLFRLVFIAKCSPHFFIIFRNLVWSSSSKKCFKRGLSHGTGVEQEVVVFGLFLRDFGPLLWLAVKVKKGQVTYNKASPRWVRVKKNSPKNVQISFYSSGKPPTFWFLKATVAGSCITAPPVSVSYGFVRHVTPTLGCYDFFTYSMRNPPPSDI